MIAVRTSKTAKIKLYYYNAAHRHTSMCSSLVNLSSLQWCQHLAILACLKRSKQSRSRLHRSSYSNKAQRHCSYCEY